jgi:hypothetical protein
LFRALAMRLHLRLGLLVTLAAFLPTSRASAADATYVQLPGVSGPASTTRYSGWFEVAQESVALVPGVYHSDTRTVSSSCSATLRVRLGWAGGTVAQLIGASIGNVRLEMVRSAGALPYYQAVLRNAVLTAESSTFDGGVEYDTLSLRFEAVDLWTYQIKADGTRGAGTQGSFNCMLAQ